MSTPNFIRFGDDGDHILNTSEILSIEFLNAELSGEKSLAGAPEEPNKTEKPCIYIRIRDSRPIILSCSTTEHRESLFNELAKQLNVSVLPGATRDPSSYPPGAVVIPTGKTSE